MFVTNKTLGVMNHGQKSYGPGRSFELTDEQAQLRSIKAMLASGALEVSLSKPAGKPSDGLTVEELRKALTERDVPFDAAAKKADLATLLDAAG